MRLDGFADDLDLCARCHEQCLFSSALVLATGCHTLAPSRLALLADLFRRGDLAPSQDLADVFELGIGSGIEHANCVYADRPTWPDETRFSRAARADLVDHGFASVTATVAAEQIDATGDPFGLGADPGACVVSGATLFFTDAATRALAPDIGVAFRKLVFELEPLAGPLPSTVPSADIPSSAGFEALELGLERRARRLAGSLIELARGLGMTRIVSESPEALVALREIGDGELVLTHASEWLADALPGIRPAGPSRDAGESGSLTARTSGPAIRDDGAARIAVVHDSSRLGRYLRVLDPPRRVLDAIAGIERRDLARSGSFARPSGPTFGFPDADAAQSMADRCIDEFVQAEAEVVVTTSAYDRRNLAASGGKVGIAVRDLLEIVAEART
jgi:Fe-S oxidoreductase